MPTIKVFFLRAFETETAMMRAIGKSTLGVSNFGGRMANRIGDDPAGKEGGGFDMRAQSSAVTAVASLLGRLRPCNFRVRQVASAGQPDAAPSDATGSATAGSSETSTSNPKFDHGFGVLAPKRALGSLHVRPLRVRPGKNLCVIALDSRSSHHCCFVPQILRNPERTSDLRY